jgi:ParB/Sulfiredoxin domain
MNTMVRDTVMVAAAKLHIAPENPRSAETVDHSKIAELAENIAVQGMLTPLIAYRHGADFFVTAGGRRTRAIERLIDEARIEDEAVFPITVMDKDEAITAGNAEQLTHVAMSPLDELRVFSRPEYEHWTDVELGKLVGRGAKYVTQRRAILTLSAEVTDALLDGSISVDQGAGLTYFKDDGEQLGEKLDMCRHNKRITGDDLRRDFEHQASSWEDNNLTKIVSKEAYIEAGGKLQGDLFAEAQFILSPGILMELAKEAGAERIAADYADAAFILDLDDDNHEIRTHRGLDILSEDEAEEWSDVRYNEWRLAPDDEGEFREGTDQAAWDHWKALSAKATPFWPDELKAMLGVGWKLINWHRDSPVQVTEHILPDDLEPLYAAGYLDRPVPVEISEGGEPVEPAPALTDAMSRRIARIRTHCIRQDMVKRPNDVLAAYLVHVSENRNGFGVFDHLPQVRLELADPAPVYSTAWTKAEAMQSEDEAVIRAMKPAEQRIVLAKKMLDCLNTSYRGVEITPQLLRDHIELDAKFFKGYGKAMMVQMLADLGETDTNKLKSAALADALAGLFHDNTDWMPIGF